ncbi:hypothetical protein HanIR_Chr07g0310631 [Helianthus annuus]|nr:hypothetical protein HanIR_Chr07g0310631 [Helianthus annuus]
MSAFPLFLGYTHTYMSLPPYFFHLITNIQHTHKHRLLVCLAPSLMINHRRPEPEMMTKLRFLSSSPGIAHQAHTPHLYSIYLIGPPPPSLGGGDERWLV